LPNNHRTTWKCHACKKVAPAQANNTSTTCSSSSHSSSSEDESDVITKVTQGETDNTSALANLTDYHVDLIVNPTEWVDCDIIHKLMFYYSLRIWQSQVFSDRRLALLEI